MSGLLKFLQKSLAGSYIPFNPFALGKAKIVRNFGLSECNRVNAICSLKKKNQTSLGVKNSQFDNNNCCYVVVLLFDVHVKHLRLCWDGQLT